MKKEEKQLAYVHILVAEAYIENPLNLPEVNHKKGNKKDNRPCAIEWSTHDDNIEHAVTNSLVQKGETCHKAKLTEKDVLNIRASSLMQKDLAVLYNISRQSISGIITRKYWKHI